MKDLLMSYQDLGFDTIDNEEESRIIEFIEAKAASEELEDVEEVTLYRGMKISEAIFSDIEEAGTFDFIHSFESFSEDEDAALSFMEKKYEEVPVLLQIESSAVTGIPLYVYTDDDRELEWLVVNRSFEAEIVEANGYFRIFLK